MVRYGQWMYTDQGAHLTDIQCLGSKPNRPRILTSTMIFFVLFVLYKHGLQLEFQTYNENKNSFYSLMPGNDTYSCIEREIHFLYIQ